LSAARYVAIEGIDGCGKSTQARMLAERVGAVLAREPGGTPLGARLRDLLLGPGAELEPWAEALVLAADRAQTRAEVVAPALAAGRHVVSDRSAWSSLAYQGCGRGLDLGELRRLSDSALRGRWPDLVILLDVGVEEAAARRAPGGSPDRLEAEGAAFLERVRQGFAELAATEPGWVCVDGTGTAGEVATAVFDAWSSA